MHKVLIIDNFDSFTFNLYQEMGELLQSGGRQFSLDVKRNNEITVAAIRKARYDKIVISPGPGDPSDPHYFGVCAEVLTDIGRTTPVLGVCLGMQGMAHYFGGKVVRARLPMHGKTSKVIHDGKGVFRDLPEGIEVMRYHSLIAEVKSLPRCLTVTALVKTDSREKEFPRRISGKEEIMGLRHTRYPIEGVQFHPESFATEGGRKMLSNFLELGKV